MRRQRVDDIDGSQAAHTVAFALDGRQYEIDLSDVNANALREVFAPYVAAGRRAGSGRNVAGQKSGVTAGRSPRSGRNNGEKSTAASRPVDGSPTHTPVPATEAELSGRPSQAVQAEMSVTPAESPETALAAVVPLQRRPRPQVGEADIVGQRRQLVADVGELTRIVAVAMLATAAERLVARIVKPGKMTSSPSRVRNDTSRGTGPSHPASTSSIAPTG